MFGKKQEVCRLDVSIQHFTKALHLQLWQNIQEALVARF